jgi:HEAT repeat protein
MMIRVSRYFLSTIVAALAIASSVSNALGQQTADPYKEAPHYKFNQPRSAVMAIEAEIRAAKPEQLRVIEGKLLKILQSPTWTGLSEPGSRGSESRDHVGATTDAKSWVCRQLRQAGSERSVPALVPLLCDKDLATVARLALQSIPGKKVDEALRGALGKLQGDLLAGVIQTIGVRGDRQAVSALAPLASDKDPVVVEAALFALGYIGGRDALDAMAHAKVPERLKRSRLHALLLCAERMTAERGTMVATSVYAGLYAESHDAVIKTAAFRGLIVNDEAGAASELVSSALKSDQRRLRAAAGSYVGALAGERLLAGVLADLPTLPEDAQVAILSNVRCKIALPAALKAAKNGQAAVRAAALDALGRVGDESCVPLLLDIAATEQGELQAVARRTLQEIHLSGPALVRLAAHGERGRRIEALRALAARGDNPGAAFFSTVTGDPDAHVQAEALRALAAVADDGALPMLVKILAEAKAEAVRAAAEKAATEICRRGNKNDAGAAALIAGLSGADTAVRCALLRVLARTTAAKALIALRSAANDGDSAVVDTAVRGLADWPDAAAAPDLEAIARSPKNPTHKVLALRGLVRLAALPGNPGEQAVKFLAEAMSLASRPDEKKLALAAVGEINHPAALELAVTSLADQELEVEAATAVVKIARSVGRTNPDAAAAAVQKVLDVCKSPAARQLAESARIVLGGMVNIALQGTASSPDGLEKDGEAGGDQAAIDGDPATYWDETDDQKLYRFVVTLKQPEKIAAISILGYGHHNFAPKDFEILCDGKVVKKVENAQYDNNLLVIRLAEVSGTSVELKITGYYGRSPAIRELGIYRPAARK